MMDNDDNISHKGLFISFEYIKGKGLLLLHSFSVVNILEYHAIRCSYYPLEHHAKSNCCNPYIATAHHS